MLSCKNCGAQMSGIDLVCKNCGTPWGKKHKSRKGLYFSILIIVLVGAISCIIYVPGMKENLLTFYNNSLAIIKNINEKPNEPANDQKQETPKNTENEIIPQPQEPENQEPIEEQTPPSPPTFAWVSTSSALKEYPAELTVDGKLETAWLEGVKGNGIGEWLMYSAETDQHLSSITIYNGYLKNDKVYVNNGRIKKFSLEFSDGEIITKEIEKTSFNNAKNGYTITFDEPKKTSSVKLTILDVYKGAYYTDTGISDIVFN